MDMQITLSFKGDVPIYEQIETQIREQILNGTLEAGSSIPSMRALAKLLKVSVITVQKAYENLKHEGYIQSAVGRGTIVASISREARTEARKAELEEKLSEAIALAKSCSLSLPELQETVRLLYEESNDD